MGTRHIIIAIDNGDVKIAQYGQWDGYPDGQGSTVRDFLSKVDIAEFRKRVAALRWFTKEEIEEINKGDWQKTHPYCSRDVSADILQAVMDGEWQGTKIQGLINQYSFAADSLFCEWGYVIDFDKNTFEVYTGFNKAPLPEGERFSSMLQEKPGSEYYPIKLAHSWPLDAIPSSEEFLKVFAEEKEEEEEEEKND